MTGELTEEKYARAALTYLVEPADRRLARLLREHGAARTLEAIKSGRPPGPGQQGQWANMERWRVRLLMTTPGESNPKRPRDYPAAVS